MCDAPVLRSVAIELYRNIINHDLGGTRLTNHISNPRKNSPLWLSKKTSVVAFNSATAQKKNALALSQWDIAQNVSRYISLHRGNKHSSCRSCMNFTACVKKAEFFFTVLHWTAVTAVCSLYCSAASYDHLFPLKTD